MFQSIVVGTDGSETAGEAVREAIELAKAIGATIQLVSAYEPVSNQRLREEARQVPEDLQWMVNPREDVGAAVRDAAERSEGAGGGVSACGRGGDRGDGMLDGAGERGADL